ncbi:hypothetical protein [Rubritalea tangerina]|uniref:hypothetical protein n=1 Tax=Rubritalea tangerina TaxID=430798 RepID=UPI003621B723
MDTIKGLLSDFFKFLILPLSDLQNWDPLFFVTTSLTLVLLGLCFIRKIRFPRFLWISTLLWILSLSLFFNSWAYHYENILSQEAPFSDADSYELVEYRLAKGSTSKYLADIKPKDSAEAVFAESNVHTWVYKNTKHPNDPPIVWDLDELTPPLP